MHVLQMSSFSFLIRIRTASIIEFSWFGKVETFISHFQLKFLSFDELQKRMSTLDSEMEREIEELRKRYETKRQPILEAIDRKRKRQPQPY